MVDKVTIVDSMFEGMMLRSKPTPWYIKLGWYIKRNYKNIVAKCRRVYQRMTRGYTDEEVWNFDYYHSKWVLPRLKQLKENIHGHPTDLENQEEWMEILDKIIWAFENINDPPGPVYSDDYDHGYEMKELDKGGLLFSPMNKDGVVDYTPVEEHRKKVEEGLFLFASRYSNLWD